MSSRRWVLLATAALLILVAWVQAVAPRRGLITRTFVREGVPMRFMAAPGAPRPAVLVAHGFAGSKQLMLGYGYTLARAGYAVLLWDFGGHGANSGRLAQDRLQADLAQAYAALIEQPEVDPGRLALLGHSMGSGAVMAAGIRDPERYAAVIAVSPTSAEVAPDLPRNLLLQAGGWEGRFIANAERLLAAAGGPGDDLRSGRGRRLLIIPNAEHISILFRRESHQAALDWLNRTFGMSPDAVYIDRRILWYGLHLAGWLIALWAAAPLLRAGRPRVAPRTQWRRWAGLLFGPLAAAALLAAIGRLTALQGLGGLLVGGAVALWLLIAGLVWLFLGGPAGASPPAPRDPAYTSRRARLWVAVRGAGVPQGILFLAFMTVAFGAMAQWVWVQWWLNPERLWRWPLLALACLPWFLAAGRAQWDAGPWRRVAWWAAQCLALVGGLLLTLALVPALGFLVLLLPLLPVILGLLALAATAFDRPWAYALGSALFFGWLLAAIFPLA